MVGSTPLRREKWLLKVIGTWGRSLSRQPAIVAGQPASVTEGTPIRARYLDWRENLAAAPRLTRHVIPEARIFGGMITRRSRTTHSGGQLLTDSRMRLVPASYSIMDGRPTLPDDVDTSAPAVDMAGDHYFLGSVHPHFGHALLEGLARLWGLPDFLRQYPDGRLIVYEPEVPDFALELLKLAGVPLGRIKLMDQPLRVERLHVCDPALRTHHWVSAEQVRLWRQMAGRVDSGLNSGRRVFLSRRTAPARRLIDEENVEHAFALAGYEIVAPETLSVVEQVRLVT